MGRVRGTELVEWRKEGSLLYQTEGPVEVFGEVKVMYRKVQELVIQIPGKNILVQGELEQKPVPTHSVDRQVESRVGSEKGRRQVENRRKELVSGAKKVVRPWEPL